MNNATPLAYTVTPSSHPRSTEQRAALLAGDLGFGKHMTDHMVSIDWDAERGWHAARVQAYGPLALDPAAAVLHYGRKSSKASRPIGMPMVRSGRSGRRPTASACSAPRHA